MDQNSVCLLPVSLVAFSARDCWLCYFTSPKHPLTLSGPDGESFGRSLQYFAALPG